ncbi:MAG: hypothetical protein OIF32_00290, partial [Campylobacterales bacterium]|nr:hypothetical protein [Campylobacterales bacterium]
MDNGNFHFLFHKSSTWKVSKDLNIDYLWELSDRKIVEKAAKLGITPEELKKKMESILDDIAYLGKEEDRLKNPHFGAHAGGFLSDLMLEKGRSHPRNWTNEERIAKM